MPVVTAIDIARSFGVHKVLDGVSVSIHRGERVGVVGVNGSGKSTLGRILAGVDTPDLGTVTCRRDAKVLYLDQSPRLPNQSSASDVALSGLEEWCAARARYEEAGRRAAAASGDELGAATHDQAQASEDLERFGGWDLVHRAESILGHLGIEDPECDVAEMSGGEQRRVALARVLIAKPDLLVLDEPTNHLDVDTVAWLEGYLIESHEGAVVLITHDRYLLDRVASRTIEIARGKATSYDGGYETYLQVRAERAAQEERTERNRQNFLRTELEWLRRQPKARTGKSKSRIQRIESAVGQERVAEQGVAQIAAEEARSGKTILELDSVGIEFGGRTLVRGLELHLTAGERIGVVGANGCGKSTLLRCVTGEMEPTSGRIVRGANTRVAYLDQARTTLDDAETVRTNVIGDLASVTVGGLELTPRSYLERFLFDDSGQRSIVGTLSGGERARVALAKMLASPANLMVLDEPTNDLDIATLAALEAFLLEFGGTTIVVTHDRYFLDRVATSILGFEEDGVVYRFHGAYSNYLVDRARRSAPTNGADKAAGRKDLRRRESREKLSYKEERELASLPDQIESLEAKVGETEKLLADPAIYADRVAEVVGLTDELAKAKDEVERLIARWEELETKKEQAAQPRR